MFCVNSIAEGLSNVYQEDAQNRKKAALPFGLADWDDYEI